MTLKLKFDANLAFQEDARNAIVDLFEGQPIADSKFELKLSRKKGEFIDFLAVGNNLVIDEETILKNLQKIQDKNDLEINKTLQGMNFTVEMETGTGKTYVYLRTIFELSKKYGFKKYVIVVPSVAIREGVLKSIEITKRHLQDLYNNTPFDHFVYDPKDITKISRFAQSNNIQIMIINIDAFRKTLENVDEESKANIIHREIDKLQGRKPIEFIQAVQPIVIIDEPQSVDSTDKAKQAIQTLNPLCSIRYSATHREIFNMVYSLNPIQAYDQRLVKKIQVASVTEEISGTRAYCKLHKVDNKKGIKAEVFIHYIDSKKGLIEKKFPVKDGTDLYSVSNENEIYKDGYVVRVIDCTPGAEYIEFINGLKLNLNQSLGGNSDEIQKAQIRATIEQHFDNELRLRKQGIKVLSLFFIDRVSNYRDYGDDGKAIKGKFAKWFEESFLQIIKTSKYAELFKEVYSGLKAYPIEKIHDGYFAQDKVGHWKDTKGDSKDDDSAYDLIMKDKEKLLSFDEPLRFIFSHSALREGWDNPNVFQICTLNETRSMIKKRQEIGRGLRLAVNQDGERIKDEYINKLTVVANESYEQFCKTLQSEFEQDGIEFGKIPTIAFKKIEIIEYGGNKRIGSEISEKIFNNLVDEGYISNSGEILPKFSPNQKDFTLNLKPEFEQFRPKVIDIVKSHMITTRIENVKERKPKKLNKQIYLSEDFKRLWEKIKYKTTYSVEYPTEELIRNVVRNFKPSIHPAKLHLTKAGVGIEKKGVTGEVLRQESVEIINEHFIPDILSLLDKEMEYKITRNALVKIITKSGFIRELTINPQEFIRQLVGVIKKELNKLIVNGIKYEKIDNEFYEMYQFQNKELDEYIVSKAVESSKHIYDVVETDSEVEKSFAKKLNAREDIKLFVKLPSWFTVETPLGTYNPDWAIVMETSKGDKLYLVRETKGTLDTTQLRNIEEFKIECGKKHFKSLNVDYRVVTDANQI